MAYMQGLDCLNEVYVKVKEPLYKYNKGGFTFTKERELEIRVPCGHCLNCRINRSREITCRLLCEMQYHKEVCFVTLTYDPEHIHTMVVSKDVIDSDVDVESFTLFPSDLKSFFKRLRRDLDRRYGSNNPIKPKLRYYAVGEYGTKFERPHMHIMLMGLPEQDQDLIGFTLGEYRRLHKGFKLDNPRTPAWTFGHVDVSPFYPTTCVYIAGYIQKKLYHYKGALEYRVPEFSRSSQGLGLQWLKDHTYMFDDEHQTITFGKYNYPLPRYFRKYLVGEGIIKPVFLGDLKEKQELEEIKFYKYLDKKGLTKEQYINFRYQDAKARKNKWLASRNNSKTEDTV